MDIYGKIGQRIKELAGRDSEGAVLFSAEVKSVEGESCTIALRGLSVSGVSLTAVNDGRAGRLTVTPKVGSMVLVGDLSGGSLRRLCVVKYSEVETIEVNGGANGGLVNVEALKQWMGDVERDLKTLQRLLMSTPIAGNGAVAGIKFEPATRSVEAKIEDETITH